MRKPAYLFPLAPVTAGAPVTIAYWLNESAHVVRLDVRGPAGQAIRVLPARQHRGINRAEWDLRLLPPGVDLRETREDAELRKLPLPLVLPGRYTVNLTVDGSAQAEVLEVADDPRLKGLTPDERRGWTDAQVRLWQIVFNADQQTSLARALAEQTRVLRGSAMASLNTRLTGIAGELDETAERAAKLLMHIEASARSVSRTDASKIDDAARALARQTIEVAALREQLRRGAGGRRQGPRR